MVSTISEALAAGLARHQAGQYQQAETIYQEVLALAPTSTETLHLLGLLTHQLGQPGRAAAYLDQALALDATNPLIFTSRAMVYRTMDDPAGAAAAYRRALHLAPHEAETHYNLGLSLVALADWSGAAGCFGQAIQLQPHFSAAHYNLGRLLEDQGALAEAQAAYKAAVEIDPHDVAALHGLGRLLGEQHRFAEACHYMERAVQLEPENAERLFSLGRLFTQSGQTRAAAQAYQYTLERQPNHAAAQLHLADALEKLGEVAAAEAHYRTAIVLNPTEVTAYHALALLVNRQGRVTEARALLETALRLEATPRRYHDLALLLPKIYQSQAEIGQWRQHQLDRLAELEQAGMRLDPDQIEHLPNFYLAYQGFDDRSIHETMARLYLSPAEPFVPGPPQPDGKIHIGFISDHFRQHTIAHLNRGLIANLSRDKFRVTLFVLEERADDVIDFLKTHVDHYVVLPQSLPEARQTIRSHHLDILYYPDIGMEPVTYALATARLAPVQCVSWGHPVTTGLPTMDYFISSELFEPPQAQAHYTEKLVRLKGVNTYYYRPQLPQNLQGRAFFGLRPDSHIYLCPQTLFKFHPDFDPILAAILQADPAGQLVLLDGQHRQWNDILLRRFEQTMPHLLDRICFLPAQSYENFLNLLAVADVMLDTVHFGGGNTTLEAFAVGTPVVTLPSEFLRGRLTYGFYQKMGLSSCIARTPAEYVQIALKLGTDPAHRAHVSRQILSAHDRLFEDREAVAELEHFFEAVVRPQPPAAASEILPQAFALHRAGDLDRAEALYRQILDSTPDRAEALHLFGLLLHQRGQSQQAIEQIQQAISRDSSTALYYSSLALVYTDLNDIEQAIINYQIALAFQPDDAEDHYLLGVALRDQGKPVEAIASFQRALQIQPTDDKLRVEMSLTLPRIYTSLDEIHSWRSQLVDRIDDLLQKQILLDPTSDVLQGTSFLLAYQGFNDKEVQEKIARLHAPVPDHLSDYAPKAQAEQGKIKIGFISAHFKNHTIGRLMRGLITKLSRTSFVVTVLSIGRHHDELAGSFKQEADHYVELPLDLPQARETVAQQALDILFYTDIGMDTLTSSLAHSRLAPVQCVTWGHPVTSGLSTIDYFISSELFEPPLAEAHYTEKLVRLSGINTYYYRPQLPRHPKARADFGLPDHVHLYLCPQTLFKVHPDFDVLLGDILRHDPLGRLLLIRGRVPYWDKLLLNRFKKSIPDVVDHIQFMAWQNPVRFLNLLAVADVILDTVHFGGGNTTLEALAVGTPVVTLPSKFLRGRLTYGFYQKMGLSSCIARTPAEYVQIALKLGTDPAYRAHVSRQIIAAHALLFEDMLSVREFEAFFRAVGRRQPPQPDLTQQEVVL
ncbi:MAG: tetratricopeptide repeat protein [Anaerolineae bacterium]|nr:tetratricopeptide repeat protein [Anaerolineae bacterium]